MKNARKLSNQISALKTGDMVTIEYPASFSRVYPHTAKLFGGKLGFFMGFESSRTGAGYVKLRVPDLKCDALLDRGHVLPVLLQTL